MNFHQNIVTSNILLLKGVRLASIIMFVKIVDGVSQSIIPMQVTLLDHHHGLISPNNYNIFVDSRDLVWITSMSGLYQYDGKRVKEYKPDPDDLRNSNLQHLNTRIIEDRSGNLWMGTSHGIVCYIRNSEQFKLYTIKESNPRSRFNAIGSDSLGQIWCIHDAAIYTITMKNGSAERKIKIRNNSLKQAELILDESGQVKYVACYNKGGDALGLHIYEFENGIFCNSYSIFANSEVETVGINDVEFRINGSLLIATSKGLFTYFFNTGMLRQEKSDTILDGWRINCITPYKDSMYLIGTATHGYYIYDVQKHSFTGNFKLRYNDSWLEERPLAMYTDPHGAIWIHLAARGVAYFQPKHVGFDYYPIQVEYESANVFMNANKLIELDSSSVLAMTENYGNYIILTNKERINSVSYCKQCPRHIKSAFKDSKKRIWLGTVNGVYLMDEFRKVKQLQATKQINFGYRFCELKNGQIINISKGKILISGKGKENEFKFTKLLGLDSTYYYTNILVLPDGLLYANAARKAETYLRVYDPKDNFKLIRSVAVDFGLRDYQTISNKKEYLVATTKGIYYMESAIRNLQPIPYSDCGTGFVWGIYPINESQFLLCADNYISLLDIRNKRSHCFGYENGLGMNGVNWFGHLKHSSGKIWLSHNNGITLMDPKRLVISETHTRINFSDIKVNDETKISELVDSSEISNPNEIKKISLSHTQNTLSFDFAALSYAGINASQYEYRMVNYEQGWVNGENKGYARYVNLPDGDYSFEVRVKHKPETLHTLSINILPPFYATFWFLAMTSLIVGLFIYKLIRYEELRRQELLRLNYEKQLAIQKVRLRISYNLHDDLGSRLSALNLKSQLIAQHSIDEQQKSEINQLSTGIGNLAKQVRETIWTINSANDTIDNLLTRLHHYTFEYFEGTNINCRVKLMDKQLNLPIDGVHRREIFLCFKETLHNVLKHSGANQLNVIIDIDSSQNLSILVHDNGIGFDVNKNYSGMGLTSMRTRMFEIGGRFSIASSSSGTLVVITYPIQLSSI